MAKRRVRKYRDLEKLLQVEKMTPEIHNMLVQKQKKLMEELAFISRLREKMS